MSTTPFRRLADLGEELERTSRRSDLAARVAECLASLSPGEIPPAVRLIIGLAFPEWDGRSLNLSWKSVMHALDALVTAPEELRGSIGAQALDGGEYVARLLSEARTHPPGEPSLTILEVQRDLEQIAGTAGGGSRQRKEALLQGLFARASSSEAKFLAKVVFQEMRHGVSEGILLDAIASASHSRPALVRRANQFWGDIGEVALVAMTEGEAALRLASVQMFRPLKPMLAHSADSMAELFERHAGRLALEYKLDGARVQVHRQAACVRIYTRNLGEVTGSLPDVVELVRRQLGSQEVILDGEAIAVDADGHPLPFQHLMRRFRRKQGVSDSARQVPVQLYLFDLLYADGRPLVDLPYHQRWTELQAIAGGMQTVPRLVPDTQEQGHQFAESARLEGHEGIMAKALDSPYAPGVRGRAWLKLKHVLTLDLVVVAADWGYGRRHGWLSNYHLAARDASTGEYVLVGKTFKGLTDEQFAAMTDRLLALERARTPGTVLVCPQVVVEVLFNEIQASPHYPAGLTLRFARIARFRQDKRPSEADTLQAIRRLYERQFEHKGRPG